MNRNKLINITLSFILVLQAAFVQVALPGLVLCFGDDGHIAFEWKIKEAQCGEQSRLTEIISSKLEKERAQAHEVDCTDIDLHLHRLFADKTKIKHNYTFVVKNAGLHKQLTVEKTKDFKIHNQSFISSLNPIPVSIQNTILII